MAAAHGITPADRMDAFLVSKGHDNLRTWKTCLVNWAEKRKAGAVWGSFNGRPTRVYRVGKCVIVAQTLNQSSRIQPTPLCQHCDNTGIEPFETSEYPPEPCSACKVGQ